MTSPFSSRFQTGLIVRDQIFNFLSPEDQKVARMCASRGFAEYNDTDHPQGYFLAQTEKGYLTDSERLMFSQPDSLRRLLSLPISKILIDQPHIVKAIKEANCELAKINTSTGNNRRKHRSQRKKQILKAKVEELNTQLKRINLTKNLYEAFCEHRVLNLEGAQNYYQAVTNLVNELAPETEEELMNTSAFLLFGAQRILELVPHADNDEPFISELEEYLISPPWVRSVFEDELNIPQILSKVLLITPSSPEAEARYYNLLSRIIEHPNVMQCIGSDPGLCRRLVEKFCSQNPAHFTDKEIQKRRHDKMGRYTPDSEILMKEPQNRYLWGLSRLLKNPKVLETVGKNPELAKQLESTLLNLSPRHELYDLYDKNGSHLIENEKLYIETVEYFFRDSSVRKLYQNSSDTLEKFAKKILQTWPKWYWTQFSDKYPTQPVPDNYHHQLAAIKNILITISETPQSKFFQSKNNLDLFMGYFSKNKSFFEDREHYSLQYCKTLSLLLNSTFSENSPRLEYLKTKGKEMLALFPSNPRNAEVCALRNASISTMVERKIFTKDPKEIQLLNTFLNFVTESSKMWELKERFTFLNEIPGIKIQKLLTLISSNPELEQTSSDTESEDETDEIYSEKQTIAKDFHEWVITSDTASSEAYEAIQKHHYIRTRSAIQKLLGLDLQRHVLSYLY